MTMKTTAWFSTHDGPMLDGKATFQVASGAKNLVATMPRLSVVRVRKNNDVCIHKHTPEYYVRSTVLK
jgi:hypothetical protein